MSFLSPITDYPGFHLLPFLVHRV